MPLVTSSFRWFSVTIVVDAKKSLN